MDSLRPRKKILVIAPHSDDAEIGVGGYIFRETTKGHQVDIVVLASGVFRSTKTRTNVTSYTRQTEGKLAGELLGVNRYEFIEVAHDSGFDAIPRGELVGALEDQIFREHWDELFIPLPSFHTDHVVTYEAAIAATRPHLKRDLPSTIYAYEYPGQAWGPRPPDAGKVYACIEQQDIDAKLASLKLHQSQWAAEKESLYGARGVLALAELRGAEMSTDFAEMFYLLRGVC